jgi:hypothetical protein
MTSRSRAAASSCRAWPQVKNRRNDPSVEGAYTPANSVAIPPWRNTSRSSMLSAPAAVPATTAAALPPGLDPVDRSGRTRAPTSPARSTCSARPMTGTSPAHDTRFASSNTASTARRACSNRTYEMPSRPG